MTIAVLVAAILIVGAISIIYVHCDSERADRVLPDSSYIALN